MSGNINVNALDELLEQFKSVEEGQEKTASESDTSGSELTQAIDAALDNREEKIASAAEETPEHDLEKIAEDISSREAEALEAEANHYGRILAGGFIEKLAEVDGLLENIEGSNQEDIDSYSEQLGAADGERLAKWAMDVLSDKVVGEDLDEQEKTSQEAEYSEGFEAGVDSAIETLEKEASLEDEIEQIKEAAFEAGVDAVISKLEKEAGEGEKEKDEEKDEKKDLPPFMKKDYKNDDKKDEKSEVKEEKKEEKEEEKTASEIYQDSYYMGYSDGVDFLEKTAVEQGSWDFLFDIEV